MKQKILFLLSLYLLLTAQVWGQNYINRYEYWYDADFTSRIADSVAGQPNSYNFNTNLNVNALSSGLHTFNIRFKDQNGKWSVPTSRFFQRHPASGASPTVLMSEVEYWFDSDFTNRVVQNIASPVANYEWIANINVNSLSSGLHVLHSRFKDDAGNYSSTTSRFFQRYPVSGPSPTVLMSEVEYWFDSDFTNRVVQNIASPVANYEWIANINVNSLSSGLHVLHSRFKDDAGNYSSSVSRFFQKFSPAPGGPVNNITAYRYWYDSNFASATIITLPTPVNPYNLISDFNVMALNPGNHVITTQFLDTQGFWSVALSDTFNRDIVDITTNIVTPVSYCGSANISVPFNVVGLFAGANTFTAQLSDTSGSFASPVTIGILSGSTSGIIAAQIPVNTAAGMGYRIRVVASSPTFVGTDNGADITINVPLFFPVITSTQTTVCVGGTTTFTNTIAGTPTPFTRQWQVSTDNITFTNITNAISSAYTATLNTAGTYYYRLAVIKSGQCTGYSNVQSVTVVPDPAVTITGAAAFCGSGSTTFTANPQYGAGNCSLQWQQYTNSAWSNIANGSNPTYTTSNLTASRNYRLRLSCTGSGCGTAYSNISTLTINPLPNVTTNAPNVTICEGGQRGITAGGANTYTWTPAAGLSATTGAVVTAAPLVSTTYIVTGTNTTTGCVKSANAVFTVVTDPIVSINGVTSMCLGANTTLTSVISGGTGAFTYLWQTSTNGTTWTSISGANLATYNLTATTTGIKYYRLKITCTGIGCTAITYSNVLQISTNALPTIALAGTSPICVGGTAAMTATTTGGIGTATYLWQRSTDGGQTWTNLSSVNYPNYSPTNIQVNTSYKVTVSYTGIGCESVTSNVFNIIVNPDPSISITGATALCGAGSTTFSATTTGGAGTCGVQWQEYVSGAWTNISGGTGNSFTTPTLTATRQYRAFVACSESGCGTAYSSAGLLTINALPNVTTNSPTTTGCVGVSKTITASGANTYAWSPSAGLNTTTGATVIATPAASTTYTVTGTNTTTGCTNTAAAMVTVIPDPTISISGPNSVTSGATATLTSTATGGTGTCVYQWQTSTNGTSWSSISGANSSTYTTPALTTARYYRLTLTCNGTACNLAASNVLFISILAIKQTDIKGDNSLTTIPESVMLAVENAELINIFPNPTQDLLNVELTQLTQGTEISLRLFDATGKLVETYQAVAISDSYTTQLHLRKLAIGLYSLEVRIGDTVNTYKVAKE